MQKMGRKNISMHHIMCFHMLDSLGVPRFDLGFFQVMLFTDGMPNINPPRGLGARLKMVVRSVRHPSDAEEA